MAAPASATHAAANGHTPPGNGRSGTEGSNHTNGDALRGWSASPEPVPADVADDDPAARDYADRRHQSHATPPPGLHETDAGGPRSHAHARIRTYSDDSRRRQFPRLSRPVELLRPSYDCVVIGSGYGGGVAASRMARAGESVCVLERGKERWPGEYPTGSKDALEQLHYSGNFAPGGLEGLPVDGGDPTGMYHLIFGKGQNAVVCNGLGGTSLMNANVFLEADEDTLAMKMWPSEIRDNKGVLDEYYQKARDVLQPKRYPEDWPKLAKMELLKKQAEHLGMADKFHRVEQTTRFRNGPNSCGVEMAPSALTGQDCTGVNDGSKNTTLVTYVADAWNWGAEMFCQCEVRYVEKVKDSRGGYLVYFAWHGRNRGHFKANLHGDLMWVHAKRAVFLGAGTIGTTEILLRSKAMGLGMSDTVGQNMSGNGDILAFGYNTDYEVNSIGRASPSPYNPVGPCITGIIDNRRGHENPLDGFVIEEGTVPRALAPFLQTMLDLMPGSLSSEETITDRVQAALARWGSRLLGPYYKKGAIERTQIYLIMSHDSNQAMLTLKDDKPELEFLGVGRSDHVKFLNNLLVKATRAVGGTFVQTPFFALMGQQQVTVHPIGGACMARDGTGTTGVTNHLGEVFSGRARETHDGLIVADAAIIPCALGANPFATITALAERSVAEYCRRRNLTVSTEKNGILDLFGEPQHRPRRRRRPTQEERAYRGEEARDERLSVDEARDVIAKAETVDASGFGFTEVMSGFVHRDENMTDDKRETYELAARAAESLCESARFFLSVQAFNTGSIVSDPGHRAMLTGTFVCPTIPGSPFMVQRGEFNLFIVDHKAPGTRNLTYDFDLRGTDGRLRHFHGYKVVDSSVALAPVNFWRSASTLYVTVTEPPGPGVDYDGDEDAWRRGRVVAKGIMHIRPRDFLSEVMTLTPTGTSLLRKAASAASFLTFFTRKSLSLLLAPLTPLQYPSQSYSGYVNDYSQPDRSFDIYARDGVCTKLHMWEPTHVPAGGAARDLFMVPGAAVDHQIFALPTIPFNAVNYFARAGYRVWVTVHRIGQLMVAENGWTTYDAREDIRASLDYIREAHYRRGLGRDPPRIYAVCHCMGAVALASGLLDGTIPAAWLLGVTCSQVFMHPIWNTLNLIKATAAPFPLDRAYRALAGPWFSCSTSADDAPAQRALNQLLRLLPDRRPELCSSAACHRATLVFGRCWNHRNLNEATHRQVDRFFGGVGMPLLHLLMRMGAAGHAMGNGPLYERLTARPNVARLRGLPFLLFVGGDNAVLSPESTERTYEVLCDTFGVHAGGGGGGDGVQYRRRVVPGYGHLDCWMGRNAWRDVYPFVREEVDRVVRGETYRFEEPDDRFADMIRRGDLVY